MTRQIIAVILGLVLGGASIVAEQVGQVKITVDQKITVTYPQGKRPIPRPVKVYGFFDRERRVKILNGGTVYTIPRPGGPVSWSLAGFNALRTFYLSKSGNDLWDGSQRTFTAPNHGPFATMQHFNDMPAQPGDMLVCGPGAYIESVNVTLTGNSSHQIVVTCDDQAHGGGLGTVTFMLPQSVAYNGNSSGDPSSTSVFWLNGTTNNNKAIYFTLNGLMAQGAIGQPWAPSPYLGTPCGFCFSQSPGTGDILQNDVAYLNGHCGFKDQSGSTNGVKLFGNLSFDNGVSALDHGLYMNSAVNLTLNQTVSFNNAGFGLVFNNATSPSVSKLVTFGNEQVLGGGTGGVYVRQDAAGVSFDHCTIADTRGRGIETGGTISITNSILWGINATNGTGSADTDSQTSGITIDHCDVNSVYLSSSVGWPPPWTFTNNLSPPQAPYNFPQLLCGQNPLFTSSTTGDYSLQMPSPCRGAGTGGSNMGAY